MGVLVSELLLSRFWRTIYLISSFRLLEFEKGVSKNRERKRDTYLAVEATTIPRGGMDTYCSCLLDLLVLSLDFDYLHPFGLSADWSC
jgi:hypothetical protein